MLYNEVFHCHGNIMLRYFHRCILLSPINVFINRYKIEEFRKHEESYVLINVT